MLIDLGEYLYSNIFMYVMYMSKIMFNVSYLLGVRLVQLGVYGYIGLRKVITVLRGAQVFTIHTLYGIGEWFK